MPDSRYAIEGRLERVCASRPRVRRRSSTGGPSISDDRYAELRSQDLIEADARRAALAELDAADLIAELTGVEATRIEPLPLGGGLTDGVVSSAWHDLRLGGRMLLKDAAASLMIVLTLGLAIAANTIVFGFTDLLLLRPLPIGNAGRMIAIFGVDRRQSKRPPRHVDPGLSRAEVAHDDRRRCACDEDDRGLTGRNRRSDGGERGVCNGESVSSLGRLAGARQAKGAPNDEPASSRGRNSPSFLARSFRIRLSVVGRLINCNGGSYTVVGVAPPTIEVGTLGQIDLGYARHDGRTGRDVRPLVVMGLLKPRATLATSNAELGTIGSRLQQSFPATNTGFGLRAITLRERPPDRIPGSSWRSSALSSALCCSSPVQTSPR